MELAVRYQLNGDDGLECMRVHNPGSQTNVVIGIAASALIVVVGLVLWLALPGNHALPWIAVGLGSGLLGLGVVQRAILIRRLRRAWNQMEPIELMVRDNVPKRAFADQAQINAFRHMATLGIGRG